jgi:hypothetical protein
VADRDWHSFKSETEKIFEIGQGHPHSAGAAFPRSKAEGVYLVITTPPPVHYG